MLIRSLISVAAAFLIGNSAAHAQAVPETKFKIVGMFSTLNAAGKVERPFWEETLPKASDGKITADYTSLDQLALQGPELLRLMRLGVVDFASGNLTFMSGDFPAFDGLDLPGLFLDLDNLRKGMEAYKPVLDGIMQQNYGAKLLFMWPNPPSILFCNEEVSSIESLHGKRIRSYSSALSDFIAGAGGTPVNIAFPEVVSALQRGTIDCGVTGSLSGNTSSWWEVTNYLYTLPVGANPWFVAVNLNRWNSLDPQVRALLESEFVGLEEAFWANAIQQSQEGISCNTGNDPCTMGTKANMTLVEISEADREELGRITQEHVLPTWAQRCGAACVEAWNETVGPIAGVTIDSQ